MDLTHIVYGKALEWQRAHMHDEQHFVQHGSSLAVQSHTSCGVTRFKHIWTYQICVAALSAGYLSTSCPNRWHMQYRYVTGNSAKT